MDPAAISRFHTRYTIDPVSGCWLWSGFINKNKYGYFRVGGRGSRVVRAHRFAWEMVNGPITDPTVYVCHKCDNTRCVNPDHLFLGTNRENQLDRQAKTCAGKLPPPKTPLRVGRPPKVTASDVAEILKMLKDGLTQAAVAKAKGFGPSTISRIYINQGGDPCA